MSSTGVSTAGPQHEQRPLGRTGLSVGPLCVGTSPLADMARLYGYRVAEDQAVATVLATFDAPIDFLDTSNGYGDHGEAELRIGAAIRQRGGLPDGLLLATKVDPAQGSSDFSGDRVRASFAESLERLGVDRVPLLYLHDPERIDFEDAVAPDGPVAALIQLRDQGRVDHIGVAGGPVDVLQQYLDLGEFEVLLSHNRYTLLDRSAEALFRRAREAGVGVVNAAPYGGGMLAKGPEVQGNYAYGDRGSDLRDRAIAMAQACERGGVPLAAAALQFSLRSPLVDSTVVGMSAPERVSHTLELASTPIPEQLWAELESQLPPSEQWLDPPSI